MASEAKFLSDEESVTPEEAAEWERELRTELEEWEREEADAVLRAEQLELERQLALFDSIPAAPSSEFGDEMDLDGLEAASCGKCRTWGSLGAQGTCLACGFRNSDGMTE